MPDRDELEERMEETTWNQGPERFGGPLEVIRGRLLKVIASAQTRTPQTYGFVLTWGLVPENLEDLDARDGYCEMRPVFHVLTPSGEFLPLTRVLMKGLHELMVRINGIPLLMDMEPALDTWSTAPGVPVTALDVLYVAFTDPPAHADHATSHTMRAHLTARRLDEDLYLTLARKPEGWPI